MARPARATPASSVDGLMTHLASADEDAAATSGAARLASTRVARGPRRAGASATMGACRQQRRPACTCARATPSSARPAALRPAARGRWSPAVEVRPVMTLVGPRRTWSRTSPPGTPVSYGGRWVARAAVAHRDALGGLRRRRAAHRRRWPRRGALAIRGRRAPVAGTVCMDFTMVDVTDRTDVEEGDEAVVFGDDPTAWDVADWAGTNAWQILTSVGLRVPRVYVEDGRVVGRPVALLMASKLKTVFACQACGFESSKWLGRCPDCGEWNSFVEERQEARPPARAARASLALEIGGEAAALRRRRRRRGRPHPLGHRRVRPRARRRHRPGLDGADRRRARHRQEHAAAAGGPPAGPHAAARCSTSRARSRSGRSSCAASASGIAGRRPLPDGGDLARADPRAGRGAEARGPGRRLGADHLLVAASRRRPAASARCARWRRSSCSWPRAAASRPS